MGSNASKFRRHLQNGDEYAALQVFQCAPELRHSLDPNFSYGDALQHNTALHFVAQHGMKPLLRIFLNELGGCPNKRNAAGETALHLACQGNTARSLSTGERRISCVALLLQWKGSNGMQKVDVAAVDNEGNTALHYASATGLLKCVELLVSSGAPVFIENKAGETACDLAEKNDHKTIAEYLEAKMVFSNEYCDTSVDNFYLFSNEEVFSGLSAQDLQEAKDQLLVETSDMLHIPLFTAEVLLRNHEWSRQGLWDSWMNDPVGCCEEAGISPPTSALQFSISNNSLKVSCERIQEEYQNESLNSPAKTVPFEVEIMCKICTSYIPLHEDPITVPCCHHFCHRCWKEYLSVRIKEGDAHNILCPAYACHYLVPIDVIEKVVSADLVKRYLKFDIEAFVETNPHIKWCPYPGCGRAVKLPEMSLSPQEIVSLTLTTPLSVSHSVDCGNGHYFCWECLGEAHAPSSCGKWQEWHNKIAEVKPQEMRNTCTETDDAANWLWKVTNSKPCPNCKSPIQKDEGCNHMKCSKCRFDYCWECLEGWKKHSSATGGYFRCTRFEAVQKAEVKTDALITQAEAHNSQMQELKKFLQYYTRFRNHENSFKFEQPLLNAVQEKMVLLSSTIRNGASSEVDVQFLEDAVYELLRARKILCGSYVYGFYLEDNGYNKTIFEIMQSDLEIETEKLSVMVARIYLQTPRAKIINCTKLVKRKRVDFITAVLKGLIPPETPPSQRKSRPRRYPGLLGMDPIEDEQLSQAILASLGDYDPNNPWVKDEHGRHTNLEAIYDWPDVDSDEDDACTSMAISLFGVCSKDGCNKPRAPNCRTGEMHDYCSLICKHADQNEQSDSNTSSEALIDPRLDLMIALEMSRRQMENANESTASSDSSDRNESVSENASESCDKVEHEESSNLDSSTCLHTEPAVAALEMESVSDTISENGEEEELEISETVNEKEEQNCDIKVPFILSSPDDKPCEFSNSMNNTSVDFYLKDSSETNELNSKNLDSSKDSYSKTDKELFVDVEKAFDGIRRRETVRSSRHSL